MFGALVAIESANVLERLVASTAAAWDVARHRRAVKVEALRRRVEEIGSMVSAPGPRRPSAAERMERLHWRKLARVDGATI